MLIFSLLVIPNLILAQDYCGTSGGGGSAYNCEIDLNTTTTKTLRLTLHVFRKNDGTGNFSNTTADKNWLISIATNANAKWGDLTQYNRSTTSPYIMDCKIRIKIMNIYYWNDTDMWEKGFNSAVNRIALYNYLQTQNISHKSTSMHMLIPGNHNQPDPQGNPNYPVGGIACGIGTCVSHFHMKNIYHQYQSGADSWTTAKTVMHEVGHNLGLRHTFGNDRCDDTALDTYTNWCSPSLPGCSNNNMGYNGAQSALTLCQISLMHDVLSANTHIQYSGVDYGNLTITDISSYPHTTISCCTNNLGVANATIELSAPGTTIFQVTKTGGSGNVTTSSNGQILNITGLGFLYLKVEWEENCMSFSNNLVFFNQPNYYYNIAPNPVQNTMTIIHEEELGIVMDSEILETISLQIESISIIDHLGSIISRKAVSKGKEHSIDISSEKPGKYFVRIQSKKYEETHVIIKL